MPPPDADFSFRIVFEKGQGDPRRIFDAASELIDGFEHLDEAVAGLPLEFREIGQVAGVGELVQNPGLRARSLFPKQADEIGPDESGPPGDQQSAKLPAHPEAFSPCLLCESVRSR